MRRPVLHSTLSQVNRDVLLSLNLLFLVVCTTRSVYGDVRDTALKWLLALVIIPKLSYCRLNVPIDRLPVLVCVADVHDLRQLEYRYWGKAFRWKFVFRGEDVTFVSHAWETKEDPDPRNAQKEWIVSELKGKIWYDYYSIPQKCRGGKRQVWNKNLSSWQLTIRGYNSLFSNTMSSMYALPLRLSHFIYVRWCWLAKFICIRTISAIERKLKFVTIPVSLYPEDLNPPVARRGWMITEKKLANPNWKMNLLLYFKTDPTRLFFNSLVVDNLDWQVSNASDLKYLASIVCRRNNPKRCNLCVLVAAAWFNQHGLSYNLIAAALCIITNIPVYSVMYARFPSELALEIFNRVVLDGLGMDINVAPLYFVNQVFAGREVCAVGLLFLWMTWSFRQRSGLPFEI